MSKKRKQQKHDAWQSSEIQAAAQHHRQMEQRKLEHQQEQEGKDADLNRETQRMDVRDKRVLKWICVVTILLVIAVAAATGRVEISVLATALLALIEKWV